MNSTNLSRAKTRPTVFPTSDWRSSVRGFHAWLAVNLQMMGVPEAILVEHFIANESAGYPTEIVEAAKLELLRREELDK